MGPNVALDNARTAALAYSRARDDRHNTRRLTEAADELWESFATLNEWLSRGGFLPEAWDHGYAGPDQMPEWTPEHIVLVRDGIRLRKVEHEVVSFVGTFTSEDVVPDAEVTDVWDRAFVADDVEAGEDQ